MKEHNTFPGKTYVVTCKAGCAITDASGELDETCEPGKQKAISAPSDKLYTSEHAVVRETFKRAALALGLLGGGVDKWGKYAKCTNQADLLAVNADYKKDVDAEGVWRWKLTSLTDGANVFYGSAVKSFPADFSFPSLARTTNTIGDWTAGMFRSCNIAIDNPRAFPALTDSRRMFHAATVTLAENMDFSRVTTATGMFNGANLQSATFPGVWTALQIGTQLTRNTSGNPIVLTRLYSGFPSLQTGSEMFPYSQFDKESALLLLNSLPSYSSGSHPLQVGIHVDHQTDEDIINAIAEAEAKGWTLTVKWNGTATASAASTWGRRKPVFAKLGEPNEDGSPHLMWGHYVTNAEENGYTEFASIEEAKEHFNITDQQ